MSSPRKCLLTDVDTGVWLDSFSVTSADLGAGPETWSIRKRTLRGGLSDGVDIVEVNGGGISFSVLPTRGMGIWRAGYRDMPLGWQAPVRGPVHPKFVNLADRSGLGWLQGFDEFMVRCGLESNGAPCRDMSTDNQGRPVEMPLPLHGRIANCPARRVEVEVSPGRPTVLAVTGVVEEAMLFGSALRLTTRISTRAGSNSLMVEDEVLNLRGSEAEMQMLHHWNFGPPLLEEGARLLTPAREIAPRDARAVEGIGERETYLGPTSGYVEQVFFHDLLCDSGDRTLVVLRDRRGRRAVALRFGGKDMPCFTQWKNTAALADGYVTGLEPATNYPNPKPFERSRGRVVRLPPGGTWRTRVELEVHDGAEGLDALEKEIASLSAGRKAKVHPVPQPGFSDTGKARAKRSAAQ